MNKKIVVLQCDMKDCAPACVSSIIKYYNGNLDLETIRELIHTSNMGTNAYDIVTGVKELGFDAYAGKARLDILLKCFDSPLILHVKKKNFYHFVVVYKVTNKRVTIMDPAVGLIKVSYDELEKMYLGVYIKLTKIKELPVVKNDNHLLKILIGAVFKNKKCLALILALSLFVFLTSLATSIFYKVFLDNTTLIKKYTLVFILVITLKYIIDYIRKIISIKLHKNVDEAVNDEIICRLFFLPYSYYKNRTTGEMISRFNDLDSLKELILDIALNSLVNVLMFLGSTLLMLFISKKVFFFTLTLLMIYLIITIIVYKFYDKNVRLMQEEKGAYNSLLIESIEALETIYNLNLKDRFQNKIHTYYTNLLTLVNKLNIYNTTTSMILMFLLEIGNILILYIGISLSNNNIITIGEVMLLYVLYSYLVTTVKEYLSKLPVVKYGLKNIEKVNSFLKYKEDNCNYYSINGDIKVNNLTYGTYHKIINSLSFDIKKGEKVILSGPTASGKSTLLKILLKYFTSYEGAIYIDNIDLKNMNSQVVRNNFNYIGQNERLFTDTIINNITLGREVDKSVLSKILELTHVKEIIESKGLKENTFIEENGFNLSGGERQRIILARGLLKAKNYIFIDEALSEVDFELEKTIVKNILDYFKDKTIIYVSHKNGIEELFDKNIILRSVKING